MASNEIPADNKQGKGTFLKGAFALACLLLVAVDAWLMFAHPLKKVSTASLDRGEIFSAAAAYRQEKRAPDMVLLGSSVVTAPLIQAESIYLNKSLPRFQHRHSQVLENEIAGHRQTPPSVFSLAVGGEMASDAYLITKHLLVSPRCPSAIVYGIAPRDFQDNIMPGIDSSEAFAVLSSVDDLPDLFAATPHMSLPAQVNVALGRVWALWRYRADIRSCLNVRMKRFLEAALPFVVFDKYGQTLELKARKHGFFPEEAMGTPMAYPHLAVEHTSFQAARFEYIKRYNPPSELLMNAEFQYFNGLLSLCRQRKIPLTVVNMPLSKFNQSLMPQGFYKQYLERARIACLNSGAQFIDLNVGSWDADGNFVDSVHLAPGLSEKFLITLLDSCRQFNVGPQSRGATGVAQFSRARSSSM